MTTRVVEVSRKRHRGRRALIAIIVVIVLLVAAFFTVDYFARSYATSYVQQQIATALGQSSTKSVSVNLGSGSILVQAAQGTIRNVTVDVDPLVIDGLSGTGTLTASGVPLSSTAPVKQLQVDITIPETTLTKAITMVPSLKRFDPKVTIVGQRVTVTGSISVFGFEQHIGVTLEPQVSDGVPSLKILTATFSGLSISVTQLDKYVPGLSDALRSTTSLCIADQLPKSFELTGVTLQDQSIVSTFTGDGVELNQASLGERGTC